MTKNYIQSHIETITPFYMMLDDNFYVIDAGNMFSLLYPDIFEKKFSDLFYIEEDDAVNILTKLTYEWNDERYILKSFLYPELNLEGQFYYSRLINAFFFVCSPDINSYKLLVSKGMSITNYLDYPESIPNFQKREAIVHSFFYMLKLINDQAKQIQIEQSQYQNIIDSLNEIIYQVDDNGNFLYLSKVWENVMGYTVSESIGTHFSKYILEIDLKESLTSFKELIQQKKEVSNHRKRWVTKQNEIKWIRIFSKPVKNDKGAIIGSAGTFLDISNEVRKENLLQLITDNVMDEITMFDLDGNYQYASPSVLKNRGFNNFEELKLQNAFSLIDDKTKEVGLVAIRKNGYVKWEGKYKIGINDYRWYEVTSRLVFDNIAQKEMVIAVSKNIEERKMYEQQIEIALEKEKELNKMMSDFVSTSSHEFKTPLVVIKSTIESIIKNDKIHKETEVYNLLQKNLTRIDSEADRLLKLITDTLMLEKAQNNLINPVLEKTDIVFLIINCADRHNSYFKGFKISLTACSMPPNIAIDGYLIEYVFDNLITNALKYSTGKKNPEIHVKHSVKSIEVDFVDYGIGIPAECMDKLFTPFFRAPNTKGIQGTGMGLCVVKKALDAHNASIKIKSVINKGTTVSIIIPYTNL